MRDGLRPGSDRQLLLADVLDKIAVTASAVSGMSVRRPASRSA
jgi:hypothetical protein